MDRRKTKRSAPTFLQLLHGERQQILQHAVQKVTKAVRDIICGCQSSCLQRNHLTIPAPPFRRAVSSNGEANEAEC